MKKVRTSKADAIAEFKNVIIPSLKKYHALKNAGKLSRADVRMAWNDYIEHLSRSGEITEKQASTWGSPFK